MHALFLFLLWYTCTKLACLIFWKPHVLITCSHTVEIKLIYPYKHSREQLIIQKLCCTVVTGDLENQLSILDKRALWNTIASLILVWQVTYVAKTSPHWYAAMAIISTSLGYSIWIQICKSPRQYEIFLCVKRCDTERSSCLECCSYCSSFM